MPERRPVNRLGSHGVWRDTELAEDVHGLLARRLMPDMDLAERRQMNATFRPLAPAQRGSSASRTAANWS